MDEHVENTVNESVTYISLCLQYQFSFQLVEVARNLVVTQGILICFRYHSHLQLLPFQPTISYGQIKSHDTLAPGP